MTTADDAARAGLTKVGGRPPLGEYVAEVWRRRSFIFSMARFKIESENQQNSLGMLWVVIKPLLNALVYGAVFGVLIGTAGRPPHFVEFLIIGVFVFEFFAQSWSAGGKAITNNAALVQSLAFPRMVLPLAAVTQQFLKFLPTIAILLVYLVVTGNPVDFHWLLIVPLFILYYFFVCGLALITARLSVHWRDLNNFIPFLTRLFFYTTGIFFSIEERFGPRPPSPSEPNGYAGHEWLVRLTDFQPIHEFLSLARAALLQGPTYDMNLTYWVYATLWTIGMLGVGVWFFWRAEERYGRVD
ncbi:ABC transporter permease [Aeromicrobium wangtongii]|uniref:Transport permease protein n=1 Tax=Aeromicrobium wangtongii TaxID=2969247 RepID=A0ABY5M9R5_9ACTN|nr:ABC transporter permease [Aeromicrobium wangtongii]MCD9197056.1 ABC transporter permease [Aeromicrobium wangtongii]UUP14557.1 ABC transporter permease [Aeromicrobium wangtongii]